MLGTPLDGGVAVSLPQAHGRRIPLHVLSGSSTCIVLRESVHVLGSRMKRILFIFLPDREQGGDLHIRSLQLHVSLPHDKAPWEACGERLGRVAPSPQIPSALCASGAWPPVLLDSVSV